MTRSKVTIVNKKCIHCIVYFFLGLTTKFAPSMSLSGHVPGHPEVA